VKEPACQEASDPALSASWLTALLKDDEAQPGLQSYKILEKLGAQLIC
jgi:hypothetical protein